MSNNFLIKYFLIFCFLSPKVSPNDDELSTNPEGESIKLNDAIYMEEFADVDHLMACTGRKDCPVHNPSSGRLLYYIERDAVKKVEITLNF